MSKIHNSKLKLKLKHLEKRLDEFQENVQTCHSEQQDSISNQTKKIANLEKKLQTLKVKLKKGNQKIKLLQTKLEVPDDAQSQKSQETQISQMEVQSCDKGVIKRRLTYDVLAASEFSRSQISFTRRPTRNSTPFQSNEDDLLSTIIDQSTIQSSVSLSEENRDIGLNILTNKSVGANLPHNVKERKISNLVETWMEENNVLASIGKGTEDKVHELELIVQKEPEQNKMNDQVINKPPVNDQNEDILQKETVISTGALNENPISSHDPINKQKPNKRKLSTRKTKENKTKLTVDLDNISDETKEQQEGSTEKSKEGCYVCEYCSASFKLSLSLRSHLEVAHADEEKEYICLVCKRTFSKPDGFYRHVKTHQAQKNDLKCSFCSKVFKRKQLLKKHEMTHRKLYDREKSAKKFSSRGPLEKHQVQCLGKTSSFTCGSCEATFSNRKTWKNHIKKHNNNNNKDKIPQVDINHKKNDISKRD